jgi:hypothetical protein
MTTEVTMPIFEYECADGHRFEVVDLANKRPEARLCRQEGCGLFALRVPFSTTNWQWGEHRVESNIGRAVDRVRKAGL